MDGPLVPLTLRKGGHTLRFKLSAQPCGLTPVHPAGGAFRYILESVIGEGCFGVVRRVREIETSKHYAAKSIAKGGYPSHLLRREIASLRQVQPHPFLIRLHEIFESETHVHIITELTTGGELYDRVATGTWKISESEIANLMRNIVEAIAHCHDRGVVHRDLKASNFMFACPRSNTDVRIIDFGLARRTRALNDDDAEGCGDDIASVLTSQVGTPYYVSPEMLTGESYTPLCDVWSIGVIAYSILSRGRLPFCGEDEAATIKLLKDPDLQVDFPEEIFRRYTPLAKEFCRTLLQKDPTLRPTARQVLTSKWFQHFPPSMLGSFWDSVVSQFWSLWMEPGS
ncbi:hypothetical protein THAOC_22096 [Thalassiosira oceanica]|uniref:Protein kinase domain-containing protein n=1 Tax=Thalassiosira oceanica TaxID=159749 RepID=K0RXV9_THAOC|nr:hypothetical protein THAOC_22096 [Thalassiosira oceanica]|eukprot:EJK57825.1 hypothetical protein THAOC_22096 [Thalassiosira oceanica]